MNTLFSLLSRAIALTAILLGMTDAAHAHAVVLDTIPADGAVLERAPDRIVIRFNESVALISARVLDAEGANVTPPDAVALQDRVLRIELPQELPAGTYVASYRVVSADSHPIGGTFVFSVGTAAGTPLTPIAVDDTGWRAAMVMVRVVLHAGILGGAGGVLFLLMVQPPAVIANTTARIAVALAAAGIGAALLATGIQGGLLTAGPATSLLRFETWGIGLAWGFGQSAAAVVAGLGLIAVGLWRTPGPMARALALAGAAIALASFALSGHVATAEPRGLSVIALLLHTATVAFWLGALVPLRHAVGVLGKEAAPVVQRFSRMAIVAVPLLILAGLAIALLQVPSLAALFATNYGLVLLAKLGLVAGLLLLAAVNRFRLTPRLACGEPRAARALRGTITAELAFALSILVATAALSITPSPRTMHLEADDHASLHAPGEPRGLWVTATQNGRRAEISLLSRWSGNNTVYVRLSDKAGAPIEALEVTLIAANRAAGVEPIRRSAEATVSGAWLVDAVPLIPAGRWSLRVDALVSDFEKLMFETEVELR